MRFKSRGDKEVANPQPDKFTKISNELLEAKARIRISGEENQIWEVILRQTYGFRKKSDVISLSQFTLKTGMVKPSVCRAINNLSKKNMINKIANAHSVSYSIQKDYTKWKPLTKMLTVNNIANSVNNIANNRLQYCDTQKKVSKETIQKKIYTSFIYFKKIWEKYPNAIGRKLAYKHFKASVKNEEDWNNINKALDNYKNSKRVSKGYIQNGSTWFNNWQDWIQMPDNESKPQGIRKFMKED